MDDGDYADMVEQSPVNSFVVEYREPAVEGKRGRLVGACITDQQADGLSMIYSFFDTEDGRRPGLGNYIIMDHILRAHAAGLAYVYLGYWVKGSERMAYKTRYRPIEVLGPDGWSAFDPDAADMPAHAPRMREFA
jgi:arginine-tRNA-protein transferase